MRRTTIFLFLFCLGCLQGCVQEDNTVYVPMPTCSDGIKNQDEEEVDCGGPCNACPSRMSATVNGVNWAAEGSITSNTNNGSIILLSGNGSSTLSMIYTGPFTVGTYNLNSAIFCDLSTQINYLSNGGTISFTKWDTRHNVVSGTFSFTGKNMADTLDTKVVTAGTFKYVPYQP